MHKLFVKKGGTMPPSQIKLFGYSFAGGIEHAH